MDIKAVLTVPLMLAGAIFLGACNQEQAGAVAAQNEEAEHERVVLKLAFNQPEEHPQYLAMAALADDLRETTGGRYQIEIYPNELLGPQDVTIEKVQSGQIDMAVVGGPLLENWDPKFALLNLPYLFRDQNQLLAVVGNKELMDHFYHDLEHQNIKVLTAMYGGLRNVYTQAKEIGDISDMRGLKLRVMRTEAAVKLIGALGAKGVPMDQSKVKAAITGGDIDGAENNVVTYYLLGHHKIAPYYNLTKHSIMPDYMIINATAYLNLPEGVRAFFDDRLPRWQSYEFDVFAESEIDALNKAQMEGTVVVDTDVRDFRQRADAILKSHTHNAREKVLLDKIKEILEENP